MPYILFRRTDIPASVLQVLDLNPNTSQMISSQYRRIAGQTTYKSFDPGVGTAIFTRAGGGGALITNTAVTELQAYFLDRVGGGAAGSPALTPTEATTAVTTLMAEIRAGAVNMTETRVDFHLNAAVAGAGLDGTVKQATGTITVIGANADATDIITINANPLTGNAGARTSGGDDFDATIADPALLAQELVNAINDPANSFSGDVVATRSDSVVTLTAVAAGAAGNAVTLVLTNENTTNNYIVSGATLSGGRAALDSTGTFGEVLRILAGDEYTLPKDTTIDTDGSTFNATISGSFTATRSLQLVNSSALGMSISNGHLSYLMDANFTYGSVVGAAVSVVDDSGNLLS